MTMTCRMGIFGLLLICVLAAASPAGADTGVDALLDRIEARYTDKAFDAGFVQVTTDKAMGIADEAEGTLQVQYPGKMRWVYDYPERHFFITDGETVWMYKPDENQVVRGKATEILGDSKGATFISDVGLIRERFEVSPMEPDEEGRERLQLVPKEKNIDITAIFLTVAASTGDIVEVTTTNEFENETRIVFKDFRFRDRLPDDLFTFRIPEGADVLEYAP